MSMQPSHLGGWVNYDDDGYFFFVDRIGTFRYARHRACTNGDVSPQVKGIA